MAAVGQTCADLVLSPVSGAISRTVDAAPSPPPSLPPPASLRLWSVSLKTTQILATLQQTELSEDTSRPRVLSVTSLLVARGARPRGDRHSEQPEGVEKAGGAGIFNLSNSSCADNLNNSDAVCGTVVTTALLISWSSFFLHCLQSSSSSPLSSPSPQSSHCGQHTVVVSIIIIITTITETDVAAAILLLD